MAALSRVANQELFKSINRLLLNVIDYGTRSFLSYFEKLLIGQWYKGMHLWAKAPDMVKNEKLQCRTT